ncbi:Replication factor C small subunit [Candidatus Burarchaeum australiense]|nr:Replication factor C small subunit [Candidatus Burarchaeum australiense]
MEATEIIWTEKYRPHTLDELVGQKETVERLKAYVKARNMPHLLFAGPPGVGKTTATLALCRDLFGERYRESLLELNASDERGIDVVREKIKDYARTMALSEVPFKIIFLDEADALTSDAQNALRRTMELYASTTRFILSCNYSSKVIAPIQSRCAVFRFRALEEKEIARMLDHIAKKEKLHLTDEGVKAIIYVSEGDLRMAINALQGAASISGKITDEAVFKASSRAKPDEIEKMVKHAIDGEFMKAREALDKVMVEYGMSGEDVILQVYKEVTGLDIDDHKKVMMIDRIGEYNFRLSEGANERIQLEALLAQLMLLGEDSRKK